MTIAKLADDSPAFDTAVPLSPTALNLMRDTVLALDEASRLGGVVFCGSYGHRVEYTAQTFQIIWRGGFTWLSGMTTLRVITHTTGTVETGDTLRVYRGDDDATYTDHTVSSGTQTHTITISSGYSHEQAVRVRCALIHPGPVPDIYEGCFVEVVLVEVLPVSLASWPGLPTFSTAADLSATKLTQFGDALDWLVRRAALRFDPLFIAQIRRNGGWHDAVSLENEPDVMWRGGFRRSLLHTTLTVSGATLRLWGGATERVRLFVNDSLVATHSVPTSIGESSFSLTHSLSGYSDGSVNRVVVQFDRTGGGDAAGTINRWSVREVRVDGPGGSVATLSEWAIRQASVSAASALSWIQSARTIAQAVYDRIAANGALWGVQRAFSARPAYDDYQFRVYEPWSIPVCWGRAGEAILLRGKGLTLSYGPGTIRDAATDELTEIGAYKLENFRTQQVIDGDAVETARYYLDSVSGLPAGAPYNVRGEECYVAFEQLKVVEA